jgi:hypothetical protein
MLRSKRSLYLLGTLLALALALQGCSDSTAPVGDGSDLGRVGAEGIYDPGSGTFVLKTLQLPPPWDGPPIWIQLIGSNLGIDNSGELVSLDVAIRSLHPDPLYAPAVVWVEGFTPPGVSVTNADYVLMPPTPSDPDTIAYFERFGFDYSGLLGDGVLDPEETSEARTWIFHDPGQGPFSFGGWAEFGFGPDLPRIAGRCFFDQNGNGWPEPQEPALGGSWVVAILPNGDRIDVLPDPGGRYSFPIDQVGLYELRCELMWMMPWMPCWTTPHPLAVVITPGPDGAPRSFLDAHFGMCWEAPPHPPPIVFTEQPPGELHFGHWTLIEAQVFGRHFLRMRVGFSGCQPEHPFTLYASGGYMESLPPQIHVVLVHEIEEECDAWFEAELAFDLLPLWEDFLADYGPGMLILDLVTFDGEVHQLEFPVFPPD